MEFTISFLKYFWWSLYLVSPLLIFLIILVIILSIFVWKREKWHLFDTLYWAFITATTVGYGDIKPLKKLSRIISIFIALVGIMFTGIIVAVTLNTTSIVLEKHLNKEVIEKMERL